MSDDLFCTKCGAKLDPSKAVWLDMNLWTHEYRAEPWPEQDSQGGFPFGPDCAKHVAAPSPQDGGRRG